MKYPDFWNKRTLISAILRPFSFIFIALSKLRRLISHESDLGFPVICVGNITVGGTGKTQIIKALASHYMRQNKQISIICKGYNAKNTGAIFADPGMSPELIGDEALELARSLSSLGDPNIIVAKSPYKAINLLNKIKPDLILVDDGMQNPSFKKDINIVMVDGDRGFGNEYIIPAGPLRESIEDGLKRADIIVSINPKPRILSLFEHEPKFVYVKSDFSSNILEKDRVLLLCAIGNPERFFANFRSKFNIVKEMSFPDHHFYTSKDIEKINLAAKNANASKIVITEKDMTKLDKAKFDIPLEVCSIKIRQEDIKIISNKINERIF